MAGHVGGQAIHQVGVTRVRRDRLRLGEPRLVLLVPLNGVAGCILYPALDGPHHVGQLVAREGDLLDRGGLLGRFQRRRQEEQTGDAVGTAGGVELEHAPL